MKTWEEMDFWRSKEWAETQEKLDDLDRKGYVINPKREIMFRALDLVPFDMVRVAIFGQDPYPLHHLATGVAFSIPRGVVKRPPTLDNIFKEYVDDLGYAFPTSGDLSPWCREGVLLWNSIPTCIEGISKSTDWLEWTCLTEEIVRKLSARPDVVLVFLGSIARAFVQFVEYSPLNYPPTGKTRILEYSHPSPRGAYSGDSPFCGSRLFSTINSLLAPDKPINWKL